MRLTSRVVDRSFKPPRQPECREDKFLECRRSLRLCPVAYGKCDSLVDFLKHKIRMDEAFFTDDLGKVTIREHQDPHSKIKDEVIVEFESKEVWYAGKANASKHAYFCDSDCQTTSKKSS